MLYITESTYNYNRLLRNFAKHVRQIEENSQSESRSSHSED